MSARHRAEDADQASPMELLDPDQHRPPTVLVELPVTFLPPPVRGFLVTSSGMTDCPCRLMIRGVLSPGLVALVDR